MNVLYVVDTETTGLDPLTNEIIEISMIRLSDGAQKTFHIKPSNFESIQLDALRINGHRLADLKAGFFYEDPEDKTSPRHVYLEQNQAVNMIEDYLMEDMSTSSERVLVGHNIQFDINFMERMWKNCGQKDTYPFGRHFLDTKQIALFLDYLTSTERKGYNLGGLVKDFEVKKEKAHRADGDVRMTKDLFLKQVHFVKNGFKL